MFLFCDSDTNIRENFSYEGRERMGFCCLQSRRALAMKEDGRWGRLGVGWVGGEGGGVGWGGHG